MTLPTMDARGAVRVIATMAFVLAAAAIAVHAPGQVSMDTSVQLHEASIGRSISWNPPFMSALLRWLGGGELATAALVFFNSVLVYGSFVVVAASVAEARVAAGLPRIAAWRGVLAGVLLLNPIVMIYVGIVWKDVLFGALVTAGCACGVAAGFGSRFRRWSYAALSVVLLAATLLARQQGIFMAPVLLLLPLISLSRDGRLVRPGLAALGLVCFAIAVFGLQAAVDRSIRGADGRSTSVGYRSIMIFDAAGIVSRSPRTAAEFAHPINAAQLAAVRSVYDPSRIDYLARAPLAEGWLGAHSNEALRQAWWSLVRQDPANYIGHRATAFATLLGLRGVAVTLPVHIGVDGNLAYLEALGMSARRDARDLFVYRVASSFFGWPVYRHFYWLLLLAGAAVVIAVTRLPGRLRASACVVILATALLYLSFLPTMISSDFRYLFAAIPLVTIVWLILLLGAGRRSVAIATATTPIPPAP